MLPNVKCQSLSVSGKAIEVRIHLYTDTTSLEQELMETRMVKRKQNG